MDQRPYRTNEEEYAAMAARVPPYVPRHERDHTYPSKYPNGIDQYRVDYWRPTIKVGQIDVGSIVDNVRNGWKRCGDLSKQNWAFNPAPNYVPFNLAEANGHPSGKVSITGELVTEEMDPVLGGGYIAVLKHFPAISKL